MKTCALRIKGRFQNHSFTCVYAPTEGKSKVEKGQFHEQLEYIHCPSNDIKIIIHDFNGITGKKSWAKIVVGSHSLQVESNGNGM
jgi:hypothetical protein